MPFKIFFCYAHEDEPLLDNLKAHLRPLQLQGLIDVWHDREIEAGTEWEYEINQHLNTAHIILLHVSENFMNSVYCYSIEMKRAMERHEHGEACVIPVILSPVAWHDAPFGKLQALPKDGKPITTWSNRDKAFLDIAEGIRAKVKGNFLPISDGNAGTQESQGTTPIPIPTHPKAIQQRENAVKNIYELLIHQDTSAVVLTGIAGVGKTTLADLVYKYAEKQRIANKGLFTAPACRINVFPTSTLGDIAETILKALGTTIDDFAKLAPQSQATALVDTLKATENPRLIVLDQFDNLLALPEGRTKLDRPGVGEWIDTLNRERCRCKLLLTSRIWPWGTHQFPPPSNYMQEWVDEGMKISEGVKLLRIQGVKKRQATLKDLQQAVDKYKGHALSLTLLASILRRDSAITLTDVFERYKAELKEGLASNLLNLIYRHQLDELQRSLLFAFSVYREPVPLEAVQLIIAPYFNDLEEKDLEEKAYAELSKLRDQKLLEAAEHRCYKLHIIIADYAQDHFLKESKQAHRDALQTAHAQAVQYYLQQIPQHKFPHEEKLYPSEVHCITEAAWHYCQAEHWQDAYELLKDKKIFAILRQLGDNATLLELYQLLLPARDRCYPDRAQQADIYRDIGSVYKTLGKKDIARDFFRFALEHYQQIETKRVDEAMMLTYLGRVEADLAHKRVALDYCEQALTITQEQGDRKGEGWTVAELGRIYNALGEKRRALKEYHKALKIMREVKDSQGEGRVWNQLSRVFRALGKLTMAKRCSLRALEILRPVGDYVEIGRTLSNLSRVHCALDEYEEALKCCDEALKTLRKTEDRTWEGKTLSNLALVYDHRKDDRKALSVYKEALAILEEVNDVGTKAGTLNRLARFYANRGQPENALRYYKDAVNLYSHKEEGDKWERGTTLNNIGLLYLANRQYKVALAYFTVAMSFFEEVGRPTHSTTRDYIAQLRKEMGESEYHTLQGEMDYRQAVQMISQTLGVSPF